MPVRICAATVAADVEAAARLFDAYAAAIGVDLSFQNFAAERASLPGGYAPPAGALLLAQGEGDVALGCVALRATDQPGRCEMKRLYVAPEGRGQGIGRALIEAVMREAARLGYRDIVLDTLPTMTAAIALYRDAGFTAVEAYYATPLAGTIFLGRRLAA
jgi:ribosomal protein S18 acetylase RimI-like enzyme